MSKRKWLCVLAAVVAILLQAYWYEIRCTDSTTNWMNEVPYVH